MSLASVILAAAIKGTADLSLLLFVTVILCEIVLGVSVKVSVVSKESLGRRDDGLFLLRGPFTLCLVG